MAASASRSILSTPSSVVTRAGAVATLVERDGHEILEVRDRVGRVLFEYDADTGRGSLMAESGLSLHAPEGDINLVAGGAIRCWAAGQVAINSASGTSFGAQAGAQKSTVRVTPAGVAVAAETISMGATRADLRFEHATYKGRLFVSVIERVHSTVSKLESVAERVITRADHLFQEVRELHELRAGRLRAVVDESIDLHGSEVRMNADHDVRIDGNRIHLG